MLGDSGGLLVSIEGCDGSGKTSLCSEIERKIGRPVKTFHYPNRDGLHGELLSSFLNKTLALEAHYTHLLFSSNRYSEKDDIEQALHSFDLVLVDRYIHSGIAYSTARGVCKKWCVELEREMPRPDLIILLKCTTAEASRRILSRGSSRGGGRFPERDETDMGFQTRVQDEYTKLMGSKWRIIETDGQTLHTISESAINLIEHELSKKNPDNKFLA
jgi:dTMP kinase